MFPFVWPTVQDVYETDILKMFRSVAALNPRSPESVKRQIYEICRMFPGVRCVSSVQWSSSPCASSRLGVASWVISGISGRFVFPTSDLRSRLPTLRLSLSCPDVDAVISSSISAKPKRPNSIWSAGSSTSANLLLCVISQSFVWLTDYTVCVTVCWLCLRSPPAVRWMMEIIFIRWKSGQASRRMFFFPFSLSLSLSLLAYCEARLFLESGWVLYSASFRSVSLGEPASDLKWSHPTWSPPSLWSLSQVLQMTSLLVWERWWEVSLSLFCLSVSLQPDN